MNYRNQYIVFYLKEGENGPDPEVQCLTFINLLKKSIASTNSVLSNIPVSKILPQKLW
jgi:hypothetical protein